MKRYGDYLVKDGATLYAIALRFTSESLRLARCDLRSLAWKAERHKHRNELAGLQRLSFEVRDISDGTEEIEYYCAPEDCVYKPKWKAA